jgi:tetratricopeptide (TPR) repeat protein
MKSNARKLARKLIGPLLALAIVGSACFGGGGNEPLEQITSIRESEAKDIGPPESVDPKDFAQPGLIVQTNSPTWEDLVKAPKGRGAVVLFVQPGGPSDRKGIARGDMIVEVDGKKVTNAEYALTLLRSNKGEVRKVKLIRRGSDKERELEIKGEIPKERARPFLDGMLANNPNDPVLRYLRALSGSTLKTANDDLSVALRREPDFVEALSLQGNLIFNARTQEKDKKKQVAIIGQALATWANALDINPRHAETLVFQSAGQAALGKLDQARSDARKALNIDGTFGAANHALAKAELALKKPQNAAGPARAAVEANPYTNLTYYRTLAAVFKGLKRKADCSKTLLAIVPHLKGAKVKALDTEAKQLEKEAKEDCG